MYQQKYGLRCSHLQTVHCVLTAGLQFAAMYSNAPAFGDSGHQSALVACIQALGEMGQAFHSSIRALEILTTLRRNWRETAIQSTAKT